MLKCDRVLQKTLLNRQLHYSKIQKPVEKTCAHMLKWGYRAGINHT